MVGSIRISVFQWGLQLGLFLAVVVLTGCSTIKKEPLDHYIYTHIKPVGLIYTNIKLPLTKNLHHTPVPAVKPPTDRVLEIKEPFSGFDIYVEVGSNAIGDIAKANGMENLYFADQEIFSVLGVWTTTRTFLYGE